MKNEFQPIQLIDDAGVLLHTADTLGAVLGYEVDALAFACICSEAGAVAKYGLRHAAARSAFFEQKTAAARDAYIGTHLYAGTGGGGVRSAAIWCAEREQFRNLIFRCRLDGADGSVVITSDRMISTTASLMDHRKGERHRYPHNLMSDAEAIAAQRASGARDNYVPLPAWLSEPA